MAWSFDVHQRLTPSSRWRSCVHSLLIAEQLRRLGCSERQAALHAEQLFRARMTVRKHPEIIVESETGRPGRKRGWR